MCLFGLESNLSFTNHQFKFNFLKMLLESKFVPQCGALGITSPQELYRTRPSHVSHLKMPVKYL